jgi:uncharacterized small protein (DUF1192 family)
MSDQSGTTGFSDFASAAETPDAVRQKLIDSQMEAARQPALDLAGELLTLLSSLPDAFAESQRRELKRLMLSVDEKDPRVAALQASIEQTNMLQSTARSGQARVKRALTALSRGGDYFQGFVSDADFAPLAGRTVQLIGIRTYSATTEADGYFVIALDPKETLSREVKEEGKMDEFLVEIVKGSAVIYRDPTPVVLGGGSVYREYVIPE